MHLLLALCSFMNTHCGQQGKWREAAIGMQQQAGFYMFLTLTPPQICLSCSYTESSQTPLPSSSATILFVSNYPRL